MLGLILIRLNFEKRIRIRNPEYGYHNALPSAFPVRKSRTEAPTIIIFIFSILKRESGSLRKDYMQFCYHIGVRYVHISCLGARAFLASVFPPKKNIYICFVFWYEYILCIEMKRKPSCVRPKTIFIFWINPVSFLVHKMCTVIIHSWFTHVLCKFGNARLMQYLSSNCW